MEKKIQISVLGCGWLGLELSKSLLQEGFPIKGSTTTNRKLKILNEVGIVPYLIQLLEDSIVGEIKKFLEGSEVLVINIPPKLRSNRNRNHVKEIKRLILELKNTTIKRIVFVSSTAVFEDLPCIPPINNDTVPNGTSTTAKQLIAIEKFLFSQKQWIVQIVRPAGLIGEDRHPGRILSGKTGLKNPKAPINLIHRKDLINCLIQLIRGSSHHSRMNVAYPLHTSKEEYYLDYCLKHQLPAPVFDQSKVSKGKMINNINTEQLLQIKFQHRP